MYNRRLAFKNSMLYIILILIAFFSLFPILFAISGSLRTQNDMFSNMLPFTVKSIIPTEFTFENYIIIFRDYGFGRPVLNSFIVTGLTIFFGLLINSIAAFSFSTFRFKGKEIIYTLVLISFMVPFESIAIPLYGIVDKLGMVDSYAGMVVPAIGDGLVVMLFVQFFKSIPKSLIEAARVDGASWLTIFFKIIMPTTKTVFVSAGLMMFMTQWNSYLWPLLVGRSKEIRTVQIAISQFAGEYGTQWTLIYAAAVISILVPITLFLPAQQSFVEGLTAGSIKG